MDKLTKCQRMLLGIAIGDSFGAGYEMRNRNQISVDFDFTKYDKSPLPQSKHCAGDYTDDTQMSIAISELLLSKSKSKLALKVKSEHSSKSYFFKGLDFANAFVKTFKRDPIDAYARRFQSFLENDVNSGEEFLAKIKPNSIRNGAAMRSVPLGILPNLEDVINCAIINAKTTHNTPQGIASSVFIATTAHYFFNVSSNSTHFGGLSIPLCDFIDSEFSNYLRQIDCMKKLDPILLFGKKYEKFGVPCNAMRTAGAVVYLLNNYIDKPKELLKQSILLGGDTDSTASIALGICAIKNKNFLLSLPNFLFSNLTNHKYGRDYLLNLGADLSNVYGNK